MARDPTPVGPKPHDRTLGDCIMLIALISASILLVLLAINGVVALVSSDPACPPHPQTQATEAPHAAQN